MTAPPATRNAPRPRRWRRRARRVLIASLLLFVVLRGTEFVWNLCDPFDATLLSVHGSSLCVRDRDGRLLRVTTTAAGERLLPVRFDEVPPLLVRALVLKEDERFFTHGGIDPWSILRAAGQNLAYGRIVSGGSTLTMQLASVLDGTERSLWDKVREMRRARQLERHLSKERILAAYASVVPLGGTLRGFRAASLYWYGKELGALDPAEIATLVAMLPAPTRRSPDRGDPGLQLARDKILRLLHAAGDLGEAELQRALATAPYREPEGFAFRAPHAVDGLLARTSARNAASESTELVCGIELELQGRIEELVRDHDDHGVDGLAVVVLARSDGAVRALLGSRCWRAVPFDGASAVHDAGSTLKPFLYALAFDLGISAPDRIEYDLPREEGDYRPRNFDERFCGAILASEALWRSRNLPAYRVLERVGVGRFRNELERLGVTTPPRPLHMDLALGTLGVSPLALARAYAQLGREADAGRAGARLVLEALQRVPPPGCRARLGAPVSWKTGTSSQRRDAWCAGLTAEYAIVVWLGRLDGRPAAELVGLESAAVLFGRLCLALRQ